MQTGSFKKGTTFIEALTVLFIFSLIVLTFYSIWSIATRYILLAKAQLVASALTNEKLEIIRNLAFEDIVHTGMDPDAMILQDEYINRGGREFHIFTQIKNQDDTFDGQCLHTGDSDCLAPVDYKDIKITVSWDNGEYSISNFSRFVPSGIEQPDPTKGILVVNSLSDKESMTPVSGANILLERIDSSYTDNQTTSSTGRSVISGLSEAIRKYKITLTKSGYETIETELSFSDGGIYNPPAYEHSSIVALSVNTLNIYQNRLADLTIKTEDYLGESVSGIDYNIEGGRELGKEADGVTPVYFLDAMDDTGLSGEKKYEDTSPGKMTFSLDESEDHAIIGASRPLNFDLIPGEDAVFTVKVSPKNVTALLFKVGDSSGGSFIPGASVHLTSAGGYDATVMTDSNGLAFFPKESAMPIVPGETYNFSINADGFDEFTGQTVSVAGLLKEEDILITPVEE